jgi:hypothetical protein
MFDTGKQPKSINFLDALNSPSDVWSNLYVWLVNIGKYMLIFVELIVLAVFFTRFVVDKRNNDLTEDINDKVILLSNETWKKNAVVFANYQDLLLDAKKINSGQDINSTKISELISGIPSSLNLENFSYSEGNISFHIVTANLDAVKNYESALKNNPNYHNVKFSISKDSSEVSVRVTFSLNPSEG